MVNSNPNLFEEITLIAPSYRGLFGCDITLTKPENRYIYAYIVFVKSYYIIFYCIVSCFVV